MHLMVLDFVHQLRDATHSEHCMTPFHLHTALQKSLRSGGEEAPHDKHIDDLSWDLTQEM